MTCFTIQWHVFHILPTSLVRHATQDFSWKTAGADPRGPHRGANTHTGRLYRCPAHGWCSRTYKIELHLQLFWRYSSFSPLPPPFYFPKSKEKRRPSTKSKWKKFLKCTSYFTQGYASHCFHLNLQLFILSWKSWANDRPADQIITEYGSLTLGEKGSIKVCWLACTVIKINPFDKSNHHMKSRSAIMLSAS